MIAAALACACAKSEMEGNSISFEPVSSKPTKAIISGTEYPTTESFVVSAYHNGTAAYFEGLTASYQSAISLWETSTPEYWPLAGSLTFNAYSPASVSGLTIDASGVSATGYTVRTTEQMTTDLCYGSATVADCSAHPDAVPLVFSHALSQVVFRVKAAGYYSTATSTVDLAVTSLSLGGICSVGDFSGGSWTNQGTESSYTLSDTSTQLTYDGENNPETVDVCSFLFIPQTLGVDATLNVGFSISQTVSGTTYTLENSPVAVNLAGSVSEWQPGKKYIYTINVSMNNLITFTASTVGWSDESEEIIVEEN